MRKTKPHTAKAAPRSTPRKPERRTKGVLQVRLPFTVAKTLSTYAKLIRHTKEEFVIKSLKLSFKLLLLTAGAPFGVDVDLRKKMPGKGAPRTSGSASGSPAPRAGRDQK